MYWDPCKELVTNWKFVHQGERRLLQDHVQLGIGAKVQMQVNILGQAGVVGKIPYICNRLIIDQWIFGSSDIKFIQWGFCLAREVFPIFVNKSPC